MKAVIWAGGMGTRLKEITKDFATDVPSAPMARR